MAQEKGPMRCMSNVSRCRENNAIFKFMCHESKNVYNTFIFHMRIYSKCSNQIFKQLYDMVCNKQIKDVTAFDAAFFDIYDNLYKKTVLLKPHIEKNNKIIYGLIKYQLRDIVLVNNNFIVVTDSIIDEIRRELTSTLIMQKN